MNEQAKEEMEGNWQKIKLEALNEAELELGVRALRKGGGGRGSDASQANGCCSDSAILEQFIAMGAEQAKQQFASDASTPSSRRAVGNIVY